jgi:hypothetical protein
VQSIYSQKLRPRLKQTILIDIQILIYLKQFIRFFTNSDVATVGASQTGTNVINQKLDFLFCWSSLSISNRSQVIHGLNNELLIEKSVSIAGSSADR